MWQKLKNLPIIYIVLLLLAGSVFGLSTKTASAISSGIMFACNDNTSAIHLEESKDNKHTLTITCSSGANLVINGYNTKSLQPISMKVTCNGNETPNGVADADANNEAPNYRFNCLNVVGSVDNPKTTVANDTPSAVITDTNTVRCPNGDVARGNDVQNCPPVSGKDPVLSRGNCMDISQCDFIGKYLNKFINFLAALVGVAVVASIIFGGIQYGSSAGDPAKVTAAKNRIRNAILALLAFLFLYALLNFLVPGGLF